MPSGLNREQILNTVSWMARSRRFDRIVALDEADLEMAAEIREHMRVPGDGRDDCALLQGHAGHAGDCARDGVPGGGVLPGAELRRAARVYGARSGTVVAEAARGGIGIGHAQNRRARQLWRILEDLGDAQSHYLLEQLVAGDVFAVDSIVSEGEVKFQAVYRVRAAGDARGARWRRIHHAYGRPRE